MLVRWRNIAWVWSRSKCHWYLWDLTNWSRESAKRSTLLKVNLLGMRTSNLFGALRTRDGSSKNLSVYDIPRFCYPLLQVWYNLTLLLPLWVDARSSVHKNTSDVCTWTTDAFIYLVLLWCMGCFFNFSSYFLKWPFLFVKYVGDGFS